MMDWTDLVVQKWRSSRSRIVKFEGRAEESGSGMGD